MRIGGQTDSSHSWSTVSAALITQDDHLVVLDKREKSITVYDGRGIKLSRFGRSGQGPGEYNSIYGIGLKGDTIWVADPALFRVTLVSTSGRFYRTIPIKIDAGMKWFSPAGPVAHFVDGTTLAVPRDGSVELLSEPPSLRIPLIRMDSGNEKLGVIADMRMGRSAMAIGRGSILAFQPFRDGGLWALDPSSSSLVVLDRTAATSKSASYRLSRYSPNGARELDIRHKYNPVPLSRSMVDSVLDAEFNELTAQTKGRGVPERRQIEAGLIVPQFLPPINALVATYGGMTLIQREATASDSVRWQALDAKGVVVADMFLPKTTRILQVKNGKMWAAELDDVDTPFIVRYRISQKP